MIKEIKKCFMLFRANVRLEGLFNFRKSNICNPKQVYRTITVTNMIALCVSYRSQYEWIRMVFDSIPVLVT